MYALVKLGVIPVTTGLCLMCDEECNDIVLHQLLKCANLVTKRNQLYEKLFDRLCLEQYMQFEDCNEDELLIVTFLGGITKLVSDMPLDTWVEFINIVALAISSWNLQFMLYL